MKTYSFIKGAMLFVLAAIILTTGQVLLSIVCVLGGVFFFWQGSRMK